MTLPFHPALLNAIAGRFGGVRRLGDYVPPNLYGLPIARSAHFPLGSFPRLPSQGGAGYGTAVGRSALPRNDEPRGIGVVPPISGMLPNGRVFPGQGRALGLGGGTLPPLGDGAGNGQVERGMMEQNAPVTSPVLPQNPLAAQARRRFQTGGAVEPTPIPGNTATALGSDGALGGPSNIPYGIDAMGNYNPNLGGWYQGKYYGAGSSPFGIGGAANANQQMDTGESIGIPGSNNPSIEISGGGPDSSYPAYTPPNPVSNPQAFNRYGQLRQRSGYGRGNWLRHRNMAVRSANQYARIGSGISGGPTSFESASSGLYGAFEGGRTLAPGFSPFYPGTSTMGGFGGGQPRMILRRGGVVPRGTDASYARGGVARNLRNVPNLPAPDMIPAALSPGEIILNPAQERAVMPRPGMENRLLPEQLRALYHARVKRK